MSTLHARRTLLGTEIDLDLVVRTLRARWRLVLSFVAGGFVLAILHLQLATYTYTATLMVSPVLSSSSDSVSGKLSNLSGLASLAGIKIGGDMATQSFMLYQAGLYSRDVANDLAKKPEILHEVFRNQWDATNKQWVRPPAGLRAVVNIVKGILGMPYTEWQPPNGALLQEYIQRSVSMDTDPQKPIVTITYRNEDQQFAVQFLRELDRAVDNKLRMIALVRASQYSSYLSRQLETVTNADVREALMNALTDQEKIKMTASVTAPYAAQPFGLPSASRRPTNPSPFTVTMVGIVIGAGLGVLAAMWLPDVRVLRSRVWRRVGWLRPGGRRSARSFDPAMEESSVSSQEYEYSPDQVVNDALPPEGAAEGQPDTRQAR